MKKRISIMLLLVCLLAMTTIMAGCCISHDWQDATCILPKTCAKCGETEGEPLGHSWQDATCTSAKVCAACGETSGETLEHKWVDADCTSAKYCSVCKTEEGKPLEHNWVEATFKTPKTCSACGTTEGEVKKPFFEENNVIVNKKLESFSTKGISANAYTQNPSVIKQYDITATLLSVSILPSSRENYSTVQVSYKLEGTPLAGARQGFSVPTLSIFDYYTGYMSAQRGLEDDDSAAYYDTFQIDGESITLFYNNSSIWEESWATGQYVISCTSTISVDYPNSYDGLILGFIPCKETDWDVESDEFKGGVITEASFDGYFARVGF